MSYDFLGSAYINTTHDEINRAFFSIKEQTLKPNKVVLVIDGPIKFDLDNLLSNYDNFLKIEILLCCKKIPEHILPKYLMC